MFRQLIFLFFLFPSAFALSSLVSSDYVLTSSSPFNVSVSNNGAVSFPSLNISLNSSLISFASLKSRVLSGESVNLSFSVKDLVPGYYFSDIVFSADGQSSVSKLVILVNNESSPLVSIGSIPVVTTGGSLRTNISVNGSDQSYTLTYAVLDFSGGVVTVIQDEVPEGVVFPVFVPIPVLALTGSYVLLAQVDGVIVGQVFSIQTPLPMIALLVAALLVLAVAFIIFYFYRKRSVSI